MHSWISDFLIISLNVRDNMVGISPYHIFLRERHYRDKLQYIYCKLHNKWHQGTNTPDRSSWFYLYRRTRAYMESIWTTRFRSVCMYWLLLLLMRSLPDCSASDQWVIWILWLQFRRCKLFCHGHRWWWRCLYSIRWNIWCYISNHQRCWRRGYSGM